MVVVKLFFIPKLRRQDKSSQPIKNNNIAPKWCNWLAQQKINGTKIFLKQNFCQIVDEKKLFTLILVPPSIVE